MTREDELWRAENPGASAFRGVLVGTLAGIAIWALITWAALTLVCS